MYEKLTLARFRTLMQGGKYKSLTAARRAIGKASWSSEERMEARQSAHAHFQVDWRKPVVPKAAPAESLPPMSRAELQAVRDTLYACLHTLGVLAETDKGLWVEYVKWRAIYPLSRGASGESPGTTFPPG